MIYLFEWVINFLSGCSGENWASFQNKHLSSAYTGGRHFGIIHKPTLLMTRYYVPVANIWRWRSRHLWLIVAKWIFVQSFVDNLMHKYAFLHFIWFYVFQTWVANESHHWCFRFCHCKTAKMVNLMYFAPSTDHLPNSRAEKVCFIMSKYIHNH